MVPPCFTVWGYNQSSALVTRWRVIFMVGYVYGLQVGATYKLDWIIWLLYVGARFNYIQNKYEGSITNISANIDGTSETYIVTLAIRHLPINRWLSIIRCVLEMTDATQKATYEKMAAAYTTGSNESDSRSGTVCWQVSRLYPDGLGHQFYHWFWFQMEESQYRYKTWIHDRLISRTTRNVMIRIVHRR